MVLRLTFIILIITLLLPSFHATTTIVMRHAMITAVGPSDQIVIPNGADVVDCAEDNSWCQDLWTG